MASQRDQQQLKKVGLEGFALIDECYGRTTRRSNSNQSQKLQYSPQPRQVLNQSHYQYFYRQHQQSYVWQVPQVCTVTKEPVIGCQGTASRHQYYGSISEGPHAYTVTKEPVTNWHATSSQHQSYFGRSISEGTQAFTVKKEPVHNHHGTSSHHQYYGVVERPQVSGAKESFVRSNEAAEFHGGTMVIDYSKNKPLRQAYY